MVARTRDPGVLGREDGKPDAEELPGIEAGAALWPARGAARPKKHAGVRKQVSLQVSADEFRRLKAAADRAGVPLSDLLRAKLASWMKRLPGS